MKNSGVIIRVLTSLWIVAVITGTSVLMKYDYTPGASSKLADYWPVDSKIPLAADRPTVIMFAHPQCPCTKVSISELNSLMNNDSKKSKTYVLLFQPKSLPSDWDKTSLLTRAQAIPGVTVLTDIDSIEAKKFHSVTSGQTLIYSPKGRLLFNGGLTLARGQEGENIGLDSARLALATNSSRGANTPVFGCSLITVK